MCSCTEIHCNTNSPLYAGLDTPYLFEVKNLETGESLVDKSAVKELLKVFDLPGDSRDFQ